ncbi:MAG: hypothetical protein LBC41_10840 [Clostridiales bacterium]|jgi:hypothetical protein|nr:hypothetical protein [Clostridiales bacterium]
MGLFDKMKSIATDVASGIASQASAAATAAMNAAGAASAPGGAAGPAKADPKKEQIRSIFNSRVPEGESYSVIAGMFLVTTKKLTKEIRTYYNYIIGYKDGDDPEIVSLSTTNDLATVDEPVYLKKSECDKAEYLQNTASFSITSKTLENPLNFGIITSAAWGHSGALIIPVGYQDEFMPVTEFFQNRYAK